MQTINIPRLDKYICFLDNTIRTHYEKWMLSEMITCNEIEGYPDYFGKNYVYKREFYKRVAEVLGNEVSTKILMIENELIDNISYSMGGPIFKVKFTKNIFEFLTSINKQTFFWEANVRPVTHDKAHDFEIYKRL
jgi:hypothetical protein